MGVTYHEPHESIKEIVEMSDIRTRVLQYTPSGVDRFETQSSLSNELTASTFPRTCEL